VPANPVDYLATARPSPLVASVRQHAEWQASHRPTPAGYQYNSFYDFVLKRGQLFESQPLTREERALLFETLDRMCCRFPIQMCYANSISLVLADPRFVYTEGYFAQERIGPGFPIMHGWATLNGKVIDLTARLNVPRRSGRLRDRVLGEFPEKREYFGVPIGREYMMRSAFDPKFTGSIIDDWQRGFPALKGAKIHE